MTNRDLSLTGLSVDEVQLIEEYRAKKAKQKQADDFREKVILLAAKTWEWQQKKECWMAYSDFVNNFGYEEKDARHVYDAIRRVWDAAKLEATS